MARVGHQSPVVGSAFYHCVCCCMFCVRLQYCISAADKHGIFHTLCDIGAEQSVCVIQQCSLVVLFCRIEAFEYLARFLQAPVAFFPCLR